MFPNVPDNIPNGEDQKPTLRVSVETTRHPMISRLSRIDTDSLGGIDYHPVPLQNRQPVCLQRIRLRFGASLPQLIIGLDIYGDVVLGRSSKGDDGAEVDVDLTDLDAFKYGVSRRHAMLRPTHSKLFLIDLGSTNGTFVNMIPVGRGVAFEVRHGDIVALAGLSFVVDFVPFPDEARQEGPDIPSRGAMSRMVDTLSLGKTPTGPLDSPGDEPDSGDAPVTSETLPPSKVPYIKSLPVPPTRPIYHSKLRRISLDKDAPRRPDDPQERDPRKKMRP